MENNKKGKNFFSTILIIVMIVVLVSFYRKYDFNYYSKGLINDGSVSFSRDNKREDGRQRSYKIENHNFTESMFFKEIPVKSNTPYRVSCMVKTEEVEQLDNNSMAGAQIILKDTEEHSKVISGTNDWTKLEFCFNSKNNDTATIGFSLGGNFAKAKGTAWFADLSIEEGALIDDDVWKFACVVFQDTNAKLDNGTQIQEKLNSKENAQIKTMISKFETSLGQISKNKIKAKCYLINIDEPITSFSYDNSCGYYVSEKDVYNLINEYIEKEGFDHIFACFKMPDEVDLGQEDVLDWVGLGNMEYCGIGFSDIRIIENEYSTRTNFPQEVLVHEFSHTLERNAKEYGYEIPELHAYEKYGYKESNMDRLKKWYTDYLCGEIKDENGMYIGLPEEIFQYKPAKNINFTYANKLDLLEDPYGIKEIFNCIKYQITNLFKHSSETTYVIKTVSS